MKMQNIESKSYRTGKYTVFRHVCASFSLEILQAVAVKWLIKRVSLFLFWGKCLFYFEVKIQQEAHLNTFPLTAFLW